MLLKNDKIILEKDMNGLTKGIEFFVKDISNEGTITFQNNMLGFGVMSYEEFEEYFAKKIEFSDWKLATEDDFYIVGEVKTRNNKKITEVILETGEVGISSCHDDDIFDENRGFTIALCRAVIKKLKK